jgi:hypothetical protein
MGEVRSEIVKKINNGVSGDRLAFSQEELEYFIKRWITGNYNGAEINNITFFHYHEQDDLQQKEKIGVKMCIGECKNGKVRYLDIY